MSCTRCLTKEDALKAWRLEQNGYSRVKVSEKLYCSCATISRSYRYYNLPPPKRGKYRK